jgi:CheY-like chemotaxis protein
MCSSRKGSAARTTAKVHELRSFAQVLIIQPDPQAVPLLEALIRSWGAATHVAHSESDAQHRLAHHSYNLVLVAAQPGAATALSLLHAIREGQRNAATPVVAILPETLTEESKELLRQGANGILSTPTSVREIAKVCWYWLPEMQGWTKKEEVK